VLPRRVVLPESRLKSLPLAPEQQMVLSFGLLPQA
jgi:hypothetical protein